MSEPASRSDSVSSLLAAAQRARQQGNIAGARALLRTITHQHPQETRAWLLLATVAATRAEQRHAFEHVLLLDPSNTIARRGLNAMGAARVQPAPAAVPEPPKDTAPPAASFKHAVELQSAPEDHEASEVARVRQLRWPLFVVLGVAAAVLLLTALFVSRPRTQPQANTPTTVLDPVGGIAATAVPLGATLPTDEILPINLATPLPTAEPTTVLLPSPTPEPPPAATLVSPFGQVASEGTWTVGLIRPQDAVLLSGSINDYQPRGRFVLALITVGNQASVPQQLPLDLLTLTDAQGNRYTPDVAASAAYVQAFGEGQAGLVSMDQAIPADGGLVSVPVIFDIADSTQGLQLRVGNTNIVWPLGG